MNLPELFYRKWESCQKLDEDPTSEEGAAVRSFLDWLEAEGMGLFDFSGSALDNENSLDSLAEAVQNSGDGVLAFNPIGGFGLIFVPQAWIDAHIAVQA